MSKYIEEANMRYFLMQEDQLLGTLDSYDSDFPWVYCHFEAQPAFEQIRPLFEKELAIRPLSGENVDAWNKAYGVIAALKLRFIDETGKRFMADVYPEDLPPLIHVQDDKAWFR
ncbi:hypothetical protein ccbrp13_33950 [Ktedonobacteria bacterium brp13]|nr:hypothetical protein ccbrp13_33950 [Ktedonobacteria bacterium brp13]